MNLQTALRSAAAAAAPLLLVLVKAVIDGPTWVLWLEGAIHATYLGLFACLPPVQRLWLRLPPAHRAVVALALVLMLWGQIGHNSRRYFPLIVWNMYTSAPSDTSYLEVVGVNDAGEQIDVDIVELFPAVRNGFSSRLRELLSEWHDAQEADSKDRLRASMHRLTAALRDQHNRKHPNERVLEVRLLSLDRPPRWQGAPPDPVLVKSFP